MSQATHGTNTRLTVVVKVVKLLAYHSTIIDNSARCVQGHGGGAEQAATAQLDADARGDAALGLPPAHPDAAQHVRPRRRALSAPAQNTLRPVRRGQCEVKVTFNGYL